MEDINKYKNISKYKNIINEALNDQFLRKALNKFAIEYRISRDNLFQEINADELIKQIADTKDKCSQNLDLLYEKFKFEAEKRQTKVHFAKDAQSANELIAQIASENKAKTIIKSKSMTSEETLLNKHLEKENFEVEETDLGEWIIQLRNEGPSHMVMPAIHLSRYQISSDFSKLTGIDYDPEDVQKLVKVARYELRKKFIEADLGISGANFCIAENATFGLVSNEGNARLVSTLPKTHIVLAGLDKLIPDFETALTALTVLPRNATGQRLTANVTWINGATTNNQNEQKNLHIIFLDNGRSEIAKHEIFSQIFRCVRCGACANVCPIYRMVGGHKMGHIYIGAIGLILTYFFHGKEKAAILSQNCINCGACKQICAGGIDLPELILKIRELCAKEFGSPKINVLAGAILKNRKRFHRFLKILRFTQKPLVGKEGYLRHLPDFLLGKHQFKSLPTLAPRAFREKWEKLSYELEKPQLKIALFAGCAQDFIFPNHLEAFVKIMKAHNIQIYFPMEQNCCGLPLQMLSQNEVATEIAHDNLKAFETQEYDAIVSLCASCVSHIKHHYPKLLGEKAEFFADKIIDFSSFMINYVELDKSIIQKTEENVCLHLPCHQCRGLDVVEEPKKLIDLTANYIPSSEEQVCCGFGGSYSAKFPSISAEILENKINNITQTKSTKIVTDCPGCIMQIGGGLHKANSKIIIQHIAELLAENIKI